ncbi:hypothetical protein [Cellulomonas cellasea]|uniref:Uncharacterized protein n=1 Tax=Cellulomonas cellasea TaxID=43670 RepID=A0A4Y3KR93_9CELL|nr:hypothetical protein [Cellulomonas cellasea]GEA86483.1 hypothetical protein CCE01nite_04320 [Cellulomonas cellasea]
MSTSDPRTGSTPPGTDGPAPAARAADERDDLFPGPHAPRRTGPAGHLLGTVVGLVLVPSALAVALVGESRILVAQTDGWDASTDAVGIVLVSVGVLLLAATVYLGVWSPTVPIVGGLVTAVAGGVFLYAPSLARETVLAVLDGTSWRTTGGTATVAATSGTVLLTGALVLVAGLTAWQSRRRGKAIGDWRARHGAHAAEADRAAADRAAADAS